MIAQQGRVVAIEGDEAVVRVGGTSGCPACDAGKGCGAGVFGRLLRRRPVSVRVRNGLGVSVGDAVQLGIPEGHFLALVSRLYVLPLLAGLAGAAIGFAVASWLGLGGLNADIASLVFGLSTAGLALFRSRRRLREFPRRSTVNLMRTAPAPNGSECTNTAGLRPLGPDQAKHEFEN